MKNKQRGTILLTTLLLLAVVTLIAVSMAERTHIDIKRTSQLMTAQQAFLYSNASQIWAIQLLQTPLPKNNSPLFLQWPQTMPPIALPDGTLEATLYDAQGEFYNLNNLSDTSYNAGFMHLLTLLLPDQTPETLTFLINAIVSWILPQGQQTDTISEQSYLTLSPPYRAAHQFFASPSELRLIKGLTPPFYKNLIPIMIALPEKTAINVNTATPVILHSILKLKADDFSVNEIETIIAQRTQKGGFKSIDDFLALPVIANHAIAVKNLSVESYYFLLKTHINLHHQPLTVFTLLHAIKNKDANRSQVNTVWQLYATL